MELSTNPSPLPPPRRGAPPAHLLSVLQTLWRWRGPILGLTAAGTVLAIIVSLVLPNYFMSNTTFLALSPDQVSIDGVFGNTNGRMNFYGTGDDIDRVMAVAESDEVVDYMVETFSLYSVYDIDSTKEKAPLTVAREFLGNYDVEKTPRDAISLEVYDRDPVRAAEMARAAREKINEVSLGLIRGTQARTATGLRDEIINREKNLTEINNRLQDLRRTSGVYNTRAMTEALALQSTGLDNNLATTAAKIDAYRCAGGRVARDSIAKYRVQLAGYERARVQLDSQLARLNTNLGPIENLEEERRNLNDALSDDRIRLKQYETVLRSEQRAIEVVEEAKVPVAKSRPVRWLIVAVTMVLSFLFAVVGALLIDNGRRYDWDGIFK